MRVGGVGAAKAKEMFFLADIIDAAEAHRLGLRVSGHIPAFSNADAMIEAGYDELTHINQVMLGWVLTPEEAARILDEAAKLAAESHLSAIDLIEGLGSPAARRDAAFWTSAAAVGSSEQ